MPMPPFIPPAHSSSQMTSGSSYASLPRPPVETILYDQVYNDDLMSIKVTLRSMLKNNRLSSMPMGFPFHVVYDASGRSEISHGSYDFQERFCPSDQRSRAQIVTFSYIAPSFNFNPRQRMSWRVTIPSRESGMIPSKISLAHVEVDPIVMETSYGVTFMTDPRVLLEALSLSIELGILITVTVANCKTPIFHPSNRNLDYFPGDIIFIATDNNYQSEVVFVFKAQ